MAVSAPAATQSPWRLRSAGSAGDDSPTNIAARFGAFDARRALARHTGTQQAARWRMRALTVHFRGQLVTGGARRVPDRVDAPGNRFYRIVTVGDFLMRFSRELWGFLRGTNKCPEMRPIRARPPLRYRRYRPRFDASSGRWAALEALAEGSFRLFPNAPAASQPLRPINGRAGNADIETRICCAKKRKASALGRRLEMPVDDRGTPSPHEGSICCEKETDRFSICYEHDVSVSRK